MIKFRAGGVAAAAVLLSATLGAGPTQAWDLQELNSSPLLPVIAISPIAPAISAPTAILATDAPQTAMPVQHEPSTMIPMLGAEPAAASAPAALAVAVTPEATPRSNRSLAQMVADHRTAAVPDRERECLAGAIYFESKGEPLSGQIAVGQVIANRAKSGRFPKSWCGVVFQRSQFSFVRGGTLPAIPRASAHWKTAVAVAHIVANDLHDAVVPRALFFHARRVSPNWKRVSKVATVGNHIFYR